MVQESTNTPIEQNKALKQNHEYILKKQDIWQKWHYGSVVNTNYQYGGKKQTLRSLFDTTHKNRFQVDLRH